MADENSIIINIKAQSDIDEATKQVAEMLKSARELAAQSGKLQQANSTLSTSFQQEANAAGRSVDALRNATKQENMLAGAATSMRTELRKVQDQLRALADAGDTTSQTFIDLSVKAAKMTDTMGDMQQVVRILASDTKNLDTAMAVGGGLVGTFNAATSAMALLGGESEELNQAFLKVQAAMAILNGVQQVALVLDQRSAANVVLRTALTKIFTKEKAKEASVDVAAAAAATADTSAKAAETTATIAATAATKGFTAALLANPVGAILAAVAALAAGIVVLTKHFKEAKEETEDYSDALQTAKDRLKSLQDQLDRRTQQQKWTDEIADNTKKIEENNRAIEKHRERMQELRSGHRKNTEELQAEAHAVLQLKEANTALEASNTALSTLINEQDGKDADAAAEKAKEAAKKRADAELSAYQESFKARMQADKEAADERDALAIYEMNKRQAEIKAERDRQQELADIAAQEAEEEMAYSDEVAQHDIENFEKVKEKQVEKYKEAMEIAQITLQSIADLTGEVFGMIGDRIDAELDALENMYTTDAKEAQQNSKKKYITQEEYDKKVSALKIKQAKLDKANAAFQIGLSTAMAIMRIWADVPKVDFGATTIALTATTAALGAVQLAAALAKPLPQYAKGRKGGEGEYALVGERGAEIMYIPAGASIIPHNKIGNPAAWGSYGVPSISMPDLPSTDNFITTMAMLSATGQIDYDRMGAAIAKHMPAQKAISVNVDRNGVSVSDGRSTHTYLNTKYSGAWN